MGVEMASKYWIKSAGVALSVVTILFSGTTVLAEQEAAPAKQEPAPQTQKQDGFPRFPAGPGRATTLRLCSTCHSPNNVLAMGRDKQGWEEIITKMVGFGAQGTEEEFTEILDYLTKNFPPKPTPKPSMSRVGLSLTPREAQEIYAGNMRIYSAR
jgi:competence protein ComEA